MQSTAATKENRRFLEKITDFLLSLSLSDKQKFAIKASLSMTLAYLIPLSQGWPQAQTAAITVMLIAAVGAVGASVMKGVLRVIGTVIGATIGMTLIALFPQEREIYLLLVSVMVTFFLYLTRAYKGDTTIFMLSAITILMVFQNGEVDDIFIYGIDRTFMTIFGIVIYTMVGIFLWPVDLEENSVQNAVALTSTEMDLYRERDGESTKRKELFEKLISQEALLNTSNLGASDASGEMGFTTAQWQSIVHNYKEINALLILLSRHDKVHFADDLPRYVTNYERLDQEILKLLDAIPLAWNEQKKIEIPVLLEPEYQTEEIKELSHFDYATLISIIQGMQKLHIQLCKLSEKLNSLISPKPTFFTLEDVPRTPNFLWFDIEDLKGTLVTFLIFWTGILFWITMNPPGGFMIVTLATGLSVLTTFSPLKPSLLMIIFSVAFVFATAMYVLVLPHLHYSWELGLFIFGYSFIGFYLINPKMSVFFLLGMATLGIANEMNYNFNVFLITLFVFYAFLFILLFFYYIPFSTKPEHQFLIMRKRFFRLSHILLKRNKNLNAHKGTFWGAMKAKYSHIHLMSTVKKMQLWASQIDSKYFNTVDKELLMKFTKECEVFVYLLEMTHHSDLKVIDNPLVKNFRERYKGATLADLLHEYAEGKEVKDIDGLWKDEKHIITKLEDFMEYILSDVKDGEYSKKDIIAFYENINMHINVWLSLFDWQDKMAKIDFKALEINRF